MNSRYLLIALLISFNYGMLFSQRQMEFLGRGVVAVHNEKNKISISWRLLETDPDNITFNLYRKSGSLSTLKLNNQPIIKSTFWVDSTMNPSLPNEYFVKPIIKDKELVSNTSFKLPANAPVQPYLSIPLQPLEGYAPGDGSVGDLDGDGEYEIVVKRENGGFNISHNGICPGTPKLEAYKLDGTFMWRIDLGINIREGAHYTNFLVYDFDGNGKSEIAVRTSEGTIDGTSSKIGDTNGDGIISYVDPYGRILDGPEFLSVFDGKTGKELARTNYIPRGPRSEWKQTWGDDYGNRIDAQLAGVGYFDGIHPSILICRGYYLKSVLQAWDFRDGALTKRWTFDTDDGTAGNKVYRGQGNHNLSIGDVDGDEKDEIIYGACTIDDNGKGLYSTSIGHADILHFSDLDPDHPGLEVFDIQERFGDAGMNFRDAKTGEILWKIASVKADESGMDKGEGPGRGLADNIDPRYKGAECWVYGAGMSGLYNCKGQKITDKTPRSCNFAVWWDGNLQRNLLDRNLIQKWNWKKDSTEIILKADDCLSNNGTKATPTLSADIFGDWREEVIWRTSNNDELRIYTTTTATEHRFYTFMHDPIYRLGIAWQNVAYNQPPHTSFYIGDDMNKPPKPNIFIKSKNK